MEGEAYVDDRVGYPDAVQRVTSMNIRSEKRSSTIETDEASMPNI